MNDNKSKLIPDRIAYPLLIFLGVLAFRMQKNSYYFVTIGAFLIPLLLIFMNLDDYRNYKNQPHWVKLWLRCLAIAAAGMFFSALVFFVAIIFGFYEE